MRIKSDADGKVRIGLLEIEKGRQAEVDGERRLLKAILGYEPVIRHNEDGKPLIDDSHISISHTIGYVAVILSHDHEVGIDVEYLRPCQTYCRAISQERRIFYKSGTTAYRLVCQGDHV